MSDKPHIQFRIYKPQFDQGFEKCSIHRPPYAHYDLDPTYWEKFYEFVELSAYEKLKAENERLMRERDSYAGYAKLNDELMEERDTLLKENERLKVELAKWKNIERLAECTYKEIYANVYKLRPGKYAPNARDLPCGNCVDPDNAKIHDEICDILEERGFNGADVCTASVGIWAALAWYERLKAKLAEVEAENRTLNELVEKCREKNMEQLNWNIDKANELRREREAAKVMRGALEQIQSLAANEHEQGDSKALDDVLDLTCETFKALAKAEEIRGGE